MNTTFPLGVVRLAGSAVERTLRASPVHIAILSLGGHILCREVILAGYRVVPPGNNPILGPGRADPEPVVPPGNKAVTLAGMSSILGGRLWGLSRPVCLGPARRSPGPSGGRLGPSVGTTRGRGVGTRDGGRPRKVTLPPSIKCGIFGMLIGFWCQ